MLKKLCVCVCVYVLRAKDLYEFVRRCTWRTEYSAGPRLIFFFILNKMKFRGKWHQSNLKAQIRFTHFPHYNKLKSQHRLPSKQKSIPCPPQPNPTHYLFSNALELLLYKTPSCGPVVFSLLMAALYLSSTCPARPVAVSISKHHLLKPLAEPQAGQQPTAPAANPPESPLRHGLTHRKPRLWATHMLPCSVFHQS